MFKRTTASTLAFVTLLGIAAPALAIDTPSDTVPSTTQEGTAPVVIDRLPVPPANYLNSTSALYSWYKADGTLIDDTNLSINDDKTPAVRSSEPAIFSQLLQVTNEGAKTTLYVYDGSSVETVSTQGILLAPNGVLYFDPAINSSITPSWTGTPLSLEDGQPVSFEKNGKVFTLGTATLAPSATFTLPQDPNTWHTEATPFDTDPKFTLNFIGVNVVGAEGTIASSVMTPTPSSTGEIIVTYTDMLGRKFTKTGAYKYDAAPPILTSKSAEGGLVSTTHNGAYVATQPRIKGTVSDDASGVLSVELLRDGNPIADASPKEDGSFSFTLSDAGTYSVRITDNAGRTTVVPAREFTGSPSSDEILPDVSAPVFTTAPELSDAKDVDGVAWLSATPTSGLTYTLTDDLPLNLDTYTFKAGDTVIQPTPVPGSPNKASYTIPASSLGDGADVTVTLQGTDVAGHEVSYTKRVRVASELPSVSKEDSVKVEGNIHAGVLYSNSPVKVQLKIIFWFPVDYSTTVKGTVVSNDGLVTISSRPSNSPILVTVTDFFGRKQDINVLDLLGVSNIVFDSTAPAIQPISASDWVGSLNDLPAKVTSEDDNLQSWKVTVASNGSTDTMEGTFSQPTESLPLSYASVKSDGEVLVTVSVTDKAGNISTQDFVTHLDTTAPTIDKFEFVNPHYAPGSYTNPKVSERYGFFVNGVTNVNLLVSDGSGSGAKTAKLTLRSEKGTELHTLEAPVQGTTASFTLPENFKGFVTAHVVDGVSLESKEVHPDGIVSGSGNTLLTSSNISVTSGNSVNGVYKDANTFSIKVDSLHAGLRTLSWGYGDITLGSDTFALDGSHLHEGVTINSTDRNLVTSISLTSKVSGDILPTDFWVRATDNAGGSGERTFPFSVDATSPVVSLSWDEGTSVDGTFFSTPRSGRITVVDRNFNPDLFTSTLPANAAGQWSKVDDTTWVLPFTFSEDGDYSFTASARDTVGHASNEVSSGQFTVDRTAPSVSVSWSSNDKVAGKFFNTVRTATVSVVDKNFDSSKVNFSTSGSVSGWTQSGDTWTATVTFAEGENHTFSVVATDKAGNQSNTITEEQFTVDTTAPTINVSGLTDGVAYFKTPLLEVASEDVHPDFQTFTVLLTGRKGTRLEIPVDLSSGHAVIDFNQIPNSKEWDDFYTLHLNVSDKAGNKSDKTLNFFLNRFGSSYSIQGTNYSGKYLQSAPSVSIEELSVEELSNFDVKVSLDGRVVSYDKKHLGVKTVKPSETSPLWKYTYTLSDAFQQEGTYLIEVSSKTSGKRDNVSHLGYSFVVDSTAPEIYIDGVENGSTYYESSLQVFVTSRDLTPVTLTAAINGSPVELSKADPISGAYSMTISQLDENQHLVITATDAAGNVTTYQVDDFYVNSSWLNQLLRSPLAVGIILSTLGVLTLSGILAFLGGRKKRNN